MTPERPKNTPFYIGYLSPAPIELVRFRRKVVGALALMGMLLGVLIGVSQEEMVPSLYEFLEVRDFEGVIVDSPLPTLSVERPNPGPTGQVWSDYLLVHSGKIGAESSVSPLRGARVSLKGTLFYLDGQTGIELVEGSVSRLQSHETPAAGPELRLGQATVRGEIVDIKCYLGVMNPGRGKVHKSCAIRCISGGIPPGLLVRVSESESLVVLLVGSDGRQLNREVLSLVGEPVEARGELVRRGDGLILRVEPAAIQVWGEAPGLLGSFE